MKDEKQLLKDSKVNVKAKLSALWIVIMILYIYNDMFSLFKPGVLQSMLDGYMGPFLASQGGLFAAAVLMAIPALMIFLSLVMKAKVNRIVNIVVSILYIGVMITSLIGEWYYYIFMGAVEIACNILIIVLAIKWPRVTE